jgi:hypothetical protein
MRSLFASLSVSSVVQAADVDVFKARRAAVMEAIESTMLEARE